MSKRFVIPAFALLLFSATARPAPLAPATYSLDFSTFIGGSAFEQIRDITSDGAGNIYVVGGTQSTNYPTTAGAYQTGHNGWMDVFVTKLAPDGSLVWSTLIGGPNYDRAYGVELDSQGNVCVTGRSGPGFPTTAGAFQTTYRGYYSGNAYGDQNSFLLKLKPDGSGLLWSSYCGIHAGNRDLAVDGNGDIYVYTSSYNGAGLTNPASWFTNAFQPAPVGGASGNDICVLKLKGDGSQVLWGTYLGGSGTESGKGSIRVDSSGRPIVLTNTNSTNIPLANAHQATFRGVNDFYLAKLAADGSSLVFATYFGGSDADWCETHHLELDGAQNIFISGITHSPDFPVTAGAYQTSFGGVNGRKYFHATGDGYAAKFTPGGQLIASTYLGGRYGDGAQGMGVDAQGNVYVTGGTVSDNYPLTSDAYQTTFRGVEDFMVSKLSADLSQLLFSTYLGSTAQDEGRTAWADANGTFYVAGQTAGGNWPTLNAMQPSYGGGSGDNVVAKFTLSTSSGDTTPPTLSITSPTSASTYSTSSTPLSIGGTASDNVGVVLVDWSNAGTGATGTASGTGSWTATIALASGTNAITVTAWDAAGNSASDTLTVDYTPSADSDGDGLPDSWEIQHFGNLAQGAGGDFDSDGLTNMEEYTNGTDPTKVDTDGDTLSDGAEVNTHGTDPLNVDTDGDGYNDDVEIAQGTNPLNPGSFPGSGGGSGGGSSSGGCGATGLEVFLLLGLAGVRRRVLTNQRR